MRYWAGSNFAAKATKYNFTPMIEATTKIIIFSAKFVNFFRKCLNKKKKFPVVNTHTDVPISTIGMKHRRNVNLSHFYQKVGFTRFGNEKSRPEA